MELNTDCIAPAALRWWKSLSAEARAEFVEELWEVEQERLAEHEEDEESA